MKAINYPSISSELFSETCCCSTKVMFDNHMNFSILKKKITMLLGTFLILFLLPSKSFSQSYSQAYVLTDKTEYYPVYCLKIRDHNWLPGDGFMMVLEDYPVIHGHDTLYSVVDSLAS